MLYEFLLKACGTLHRLLPVNDPGVATRTYCHVADHLVVRECALMDTDV